MKSGTKSSQQMETIPERATEMRSNAKVPAEVIEKLPCLKPNAVRVAIGIASFMNSRTGDCYPCRKTIAVRSGIGGKRLRRGRKRSRRGAAGSDHERRSLRGVTTATKELTKHGLLDITSRRDLRGTNIYRWAEPDDAPGSASGFYSFIPYTVVGAMPRLSRGALCMALVLGCHMTVEGRCERELCDLIEVAGIKSRRKAYQYLRELERCGVLKVLRYRGHGKPLIFYWTHMSAFAGFVWGAE